MITDDKRYVLGSGLMPDPAAYRIFRIKEFLNKYKALLIIGISFVIWKRVK
tara:strand:+ start:356 stop:508 length:153 start_codon:yes stop_codon:yes gene_type:complete